jgi:hypothetical protein
LEYKSLIGSRGSKANEKVISDLRIEDLINDILGKDKDQFLIDIFKEPLTDRSIIEFRLEIFSDIMDQKVYNAIAYFLNAIKDCNKLLNLEASVYEELKYGFHIDAALMYINALESSLKLMDGLVLKSEGMLYFVNYLKNLIQSDRFQALKSAAYEAKAGRDKIKIRIRINGLEVRVTKDENGEDLSSKIEELFSRFKGQQVQEHEPVNYHYSEQITHIHGGYVEGRLQNFQ